MQSNSLKSGLAARVFWLIVGVGIGAYELSQGAASQLRSQEFLGAGLILFGLSWFLQPPNLTGQIGRVDTLSRASTVGPAWLRMWLTLAAFACLLVAVYLFVAGHGWLQGAA